MTHRYAIGAIIAALLWPVAARADQQSDYAKSVEESANRSMKELTARLLKELPPPPPVSKEAADTIRPALKTIAGVLPPEDGVVGKPKWTIVSDALPQPTTPTPPQADPAPPPAGRTRAMAAVAPTPDQPVAAPQPTPAPVVAPPAPSPPIVVTAPSAPLPGGPSAFAPIVQAGSELLLMLVGIVLTGLVTRYLPRAIKAYEDATGIKMTDQQRAAVYAAAETEKGRLETAIDQGVLSIANVTPTDPAVRAAAIEAINRVPESAMKQNVTPETMARIIVGKVDTSPKPPVLPATPSTGVISTDGAVASYNTSAGVPPTPLTPPPMTPQQAKAAYLEQLRSRVPPPSPPDAPSAPSAPQPTATLYRPPPSTPTAT